MANSDYASANELPAEAIATPVPKKSVRHSKKGIARPATKTRTSASKKRKASAIDSPVTQQRPSEQSTSEEPVEWEAVGIVSEKKKGRRTLYTVRWAGTNEAGEPYPDSEEPKENLNDELWSDWLKWKSVPRDKDRESCFRLSRNEGWIFVDPDLPEQPSSTRFPEALAVSEPNERVSKRLKLAPSHPSGGAHSLTPGKSPQPDLPIGHPDVVAAISIPHPSDTNFPPTQPDISVALSQTDSAVSAPPTPVSDRGSPGNTDLTRSLFNYSPQPTPLAPILPQNLNIEPQTRPAGNRPVIADSQSQDFTPIQISWTSINSAPGLIHNTRADRPPILRVPSIDGLQSQIVHSKQARIVSASPSQDAQLPEDCNGESQQASADEARHCIRGPLGSADNTQVEATTSVNSQLFDPGTQEPDPVTLGFSWIEVQRDLTATSPQADSVHESPKSSGGPGSSRAFSFRTSSSSADSSPQVTVPSIDDSEAGTPREQIVFETASAEAIFSSVAADVSIPVTLALHTPPANTAQQAVDFNVPNSVSHAARATQELNSSVPIPQEPTSSSVDLPVPSKQDTFLLDSAAPPRPTTPSVMSDSEKQSLGGSAIGRSPKSLFARQFGSIANKYPKRGAPASQAPTKQLTTSGDDDHESTTPQIAVETSDMDATTQSTPPHRGLECLAHRELVVPLDLQSTAWTVLISYLRNRADVIEECLINEEESQNERSTSAVRGVLRGLYGIANHPDLCRECTPVRPEEQRAWNKSVSSKFRFLEDLIQQSSEAEKTVALFVQPGDVMHLVQTHLEAAGVHYVRPDEKCEENSVSGGLKFVLLPTSSESLKDVSERPDLIIGFDETFQANDPCLDELRIRPDGTKCLVVKLVPLWTLEHIALSEKKNSTSSSTPRSLLRKVKALRDVFTDPTNGTTYLERDETVVGYVSNAFAEYLNMGDVSMIETLPSLDEFDVDEKIAQVLTPELPEFNGKKRPASRDANDSDSSTKRAKLDGYSSADQSDDLSDHVQSLKVGIIGGQEQDNARRASDKPDVVMADSQPFDLREALRKLGDYEPADLPLLLEAAQHWKTEVDNYRSLFRERQTAYEIQTRDHLETKKKLEEQTKRASSAEEQVGRLKVTAETAREELTRLRKELSDERNRLENSSIPEHNEWELLRQKAAKVEDLEKKIANRDKDLEYFRSLYQDASHKALENASELQPLREENAQLKAKVGIMRENMISKTLKAALEEMQANWRQTARELEHKDKLYEDEVRRGQRLAEELREEREKVDLLRAPSTRAANRGDSQEPRSSRAFLSSVLDPGSRPQSRNASRASSPMPGSGRPGNAAHGPSGLRQA